LALVCFLTAFDLHSELSFLTNLL